MIPLKIIYWRDYSSNTGKAWFLKKYPKQTTKMIYASLRYEKNPCAALSREILKRLTLLQFVDFVLSKIDEDLWQNPN